MFRIRIARMAMFRIVGIVFSVEAMESKRICLPVIINELNRLFIIGYLIIITNTSCL